jgi:Fe-Mn family superoxide dismutase
MSPSFASPSTDSMTLENTQGCPPMAAPLRRGANMTLTMFTRDSLLFHTLIYLPIFLQFAVSNVEHEEITMNRRTFLTASTLGAFILQRTEAADTAKSPLKGAGPYELPKLPYGENALAPVMSAKSIQFHYGKHHRGYAERYNKLIQGTPMADQTLEQVIVEASKSAERTPLFNNAAQIWNHTFFWSSLKPKGGGQPFGKVKGLVEEAFGSFDRFRTEFIERASTLFGSGWVWLVKAEGKAKIVSTKDADTPLVQSVKPLLTIDVWEHAYYLDYQNRRLDYVTAVVDRLLNWEFASENLTTS